MAPTFFSDHRISAKRSLLDSGSNVDGAFRAVASAFIDNVLSERRITVNKPLLDKILERHSKYFTLPEGAGLLTPTERLLQLINRPEKMAKFVAEFAYTLRQIAVDQLLKDFKRYMLVFLEENEGNSLKDIRALNTTIGKTLLAALADALSVPIVINVALPKKDLHAKIEYGPMNFNLSFTAPQGVQVLNNQGDYFPYLKSPVNFHSLNRLPDPVIDPKEHLENDPQIDTIVKAIEAERQHLLHIYKDHKQRLEYLVQDMSITKTQLIDIYISWKDKAQLTENTKYVGTEHGSEHFFELIAGNPTRSNASSSIISSPKVVDYDNLVIQELINSLARGISIGQLDENFVYESLNQPTPHKQVSGG